MSYSLLNVIQGELFEEVFPSENDAWLFLMGGDDPVIRAEAANVIAPHTPERDALALQGWVVVLTDHLPIEEFGDPEVMDDVDFVSEGGEHD